MNIMTDENRSIKGNIQYSSYSKLSPEVSTNSMPIWSQAMEFEHDPLLDHENTIFSRIRDFSLSIYDKIYHIFQKYLVWMIFLLCIILGPLNFILYKMLYTAYGDHGAYFVSQSINFMYVVFGAIILKYVSSNGEIDEETLKAPHTNFIIMGFLDCFAGFLSAMGASNVSGAAQQLLNQSLIPCTMFASYLILGTQSSYMQIFGSFNILIGSFIVVLPKLPFYSHTSLASSYDSYHLISAFIYFSSNLPFAASYVFKEFGFKNLAVHVIYLTQWVSIYQLLFGFLFAPFQMLPGMGSAEGMNVIDILHNFYRGFLCFLEIDEKCHENYTFLLLIGYCIINFVFNTTGLYLVKHGSATLNAISYAIILPFTTLAFALPYLGQYQESFDMSTILGLVVVLIGFFLWKGESIVGDVLERKRQSLFFKAMNLKRYKRISHDIDSSSASVDTSTGSDGYFGDLEIERPSFEKIDDDIDFDLVPNPHHDYMTDSYQHRISSSPRKIPILSPNRHHVSDSISSSSVNRNRVESFNERTILVGLL